MLYCCCAGTCKHKPEGGEVWSSEFNAAGGGFKAKGGNVQCIKGVHGLPNDHRLPTRVMFKPRWGDLGWRRARRQRRARRRRRGSIVQV
eukprot:389191-Prorocentrum_minimum.AAC.2